MTVKFQNIIKSIIFTFSGFACLGVILGSLSNVQNLVNYTVATIGSLVIITLWLFLRYWMKYKKPYWGKGSNKARLSKPNKQINLFALGMIITLWTFLVLPNKKETIDNKFGEIHRPDNVPYGSFFLDQSLFTSIIKYFPFDLHLNMSINEFQTRYHGHIREYKTPINEIKLYGIKEDILKYDSQGRIDEFNTYFLFNDSTLTIINLSFVVNPQKEDELYANFDKDFSLGMGNLHAQGANYYWLSKENVYSETLNWSHGFSSGQNTFRLFKNNYIINDLLISLPNYYKDVSNLTNAFPEFIRVLSDCNYIICSPNYKKDIFDKFNLAPVMIENTKLMLDEYIEYLRITERIYGDK